VEEFQKNFIIEPKFDKRTKQGKEDHAKFQADLKPGAIIVPEKMAEPLTGMLKSMLTHKYTKNLFQTGRRENCLFWNDPDTGELCKARFDFITSKGHGVRR
jgi:exodeoxyribonuclease VIII